MHFVRAASVISMGIRLAGPCTVLVCCFLLLFVSAATAAPTLERLRDTGVLRLGYLTAVPPFSYQDESGRPA
ncbi:MAG: hypothetical protein L0Y45_11120, partial [Woeseiaceae bacterium]|nr:hypothetical protein [Woeseiaceae bacterium]